MCEGNKGRNPSLRRFSMGVPVQILQVTILALRGGTQLFAAPCAPARVAALLAAPAEEREREREGKRRGAIRTPREGRRGHALLARGAQDRVRPAPAEREPAPQDDRETTRTPSALVREQVHHHDIPPSRRLLPTAFCRGAVASPRPLLQPPEQSLRAPAEARHAAASVPPAGVLRESSLLPPFDLRPFPFPRPTHLSWCRARARARRRPADRGAPPARRPRGSPPPPVGGPSSHARPARSQEHRGGLHGRR